MKSSRVLLVAVVFAACLHAGEEGATGDAGPYTRCAYVVGLNETVCVKLPERATCGGQICELGETCCYPTLTCVGRDAGTCVSPTPGLCASDFDCANDQLCLPISVSCDSLGRCGDPGACGVGGSDTYCACDGRTYGSAQEACLAGVRGGSDVACGETNRAGVIPCGFDSQCPEGQACCGITHVCIDSAQPWRCERQPDGSLLDCETDQECVAAAAAGGGPGTDNFCHRTSGCSGPGTCTEPFRDGSCGVVAYACGCDGVTYMNQCWAHAASTNVDASGACP
jgi:hypothetical protein